MEYYFPQFMRPIFTAPWFSNGPKCVMCGKAAGKSPTFATDIGDHICCKCVDSMEHTTFHIHNESLYHGEEIPCDDCQENKYRQKLVRNALCQRGGQLDMPPGKRYWFPFPAKSDCTTLIYSIRLKCGACGDWIEGDEVKSVVKTECGHLYCNKCIFKMVNDCLRDETRYPLKCCCKKMTYESIARNRSLEVREAFQKRCAELDVHPGKRVYCPCPTCSEFAGSTDSTVNSHLVCKKCDKKICIQCRQAKHHGECDYKEDSDTISLRELAKQQNWKVCPGCKQIVERQLTDGCYTMTCRCRTEFCYVCCCVIPRGRNKACTCRSGPLTGYIIRDGIKASSVHIQDILTKCNDNNIQAFVRFLASLGNNEYPDIQAHVPCDIENCREKHRLKMMAECGEFERRGDFYSIMAHFSHESESCEGTQSSETDGYQEELLETDPSLL